MPDPLKKPSSYASVSWLPMATHECQKLEQTEKSITGCGEEKPHKTAGHCNLSLLGKKN